MTVQEAHLLVAAMRTQHMEQIADAIENALQELEDEVARLKRPGGLKLVTELNQVRNERDAWKAEALHHQSRADAYRAALVEIVDGEGLVHADALRAAKEVLDA